MPIRFRRVVLAALGAGLLAPAVHAQSGRADLRYVQPLPDSVAYASVDSVHNEMTGMGPGMTISGVLRTVVDVRFATRGDTLFAQSALRQMTGSMSTPMGDMPIDLAAMEPMELRLGPEGPDWEEVLAVLSDTDTGSDMMAAMGPARATAALIQLPGRVVELGETWTDTVDLRSKRAEAETSGFLILNGTYVSDTTVAGRTLNVLRITTTSESAMSAESPMGRVSGRSKETSEETVLWDSQLHMIVGRDAVTQSEGETDMPTGGTMQMKSRGRSITSIEQRQ